MENVDELIPTATPGASTIADSDTCENETNENQTVTENHLTIDQLADAYQLLTEKINDDNVAPADDKFKTELFDTVLNTGITPEIILKSFLFDRAINAAYLRGRNEKIENLKSDTSLRPDNPEDIQTVKKREIEFLSHPKTSIWDL